MNAEPLLNKVAKVFAEHRLEAVMIGNAAAALHGAPVTTLDIDFMFRKTPLNLKKLKAVAQSFRAVILKPYYPVSDLFRVINDEQGLQLDFMSRLHGIRSFEGLRSRSTTVEFGEHKLKVASLADIIKSKRATGRDRDLAVLEILERTLNEQERRENEEGTRGGSQTGE
jgi:predicted nucleotidyltransferase